MYKVVTLGTFDLFHVGHFNLIGRGKVLADSLGVPFQIYINLDSFIERYKGKPPIQTYNERVHSISKICGINASIYVGKNPQEGIDPVADRLELINLLSDSIVLIGSDWLGKDYMKQLGLTTQDLLDENISLFFVPYTGGVSTTEIVKRVLDREGINHST